MECGKVKRDLDIVAKEFPDGRRQETASSAGLFIVGTDTGVGKTVIACAIARLLVNHGVKVGVMKPVETGCRLVKGQCHPADGAALKAAARCEAPLSSITAYRYRLPLAPYAAARIAQRPGVNLGRVVQRFQMQRRRHDFMIVEGIGGLLVPLSARRDLIDMVLAFDLPVLLVAHSGLGTLNHTLLTLRHGRERGVRFVGVLLNQTTSRRTLADATNPAIIAKRCTLPVFSVPCFKRKLFSGGDDPVSALAQIRRVSPVWPTRFDNRQNPVLERDEEAESLQQWLLRLVKKAVGQRKQPEG